MQNNNSKPKVKLMKRASSGQSLIETMVAIGLLTTGIVGGLSLAIFSLNASDVTLKQIVATNLAREGVEVIRNFRDTNWLDDTLVDCSSTMGTGQDCYLNWDDDIEGLTNGENRRVRFFTNPHAWDISNNSNIGHASLYLHSSGVYSFQESGAPVYYRVIRITRETAAPFSAGNPRLRIQSTVWWHGRRCPTMTNLNNLNTPCKVVIEDYLTNWKNY